MTPNLLHGYKFTMPSRLKRIPRRIRDVPEEDFDSESLFGNGGCCGGDLQNQIFWYEPMGTSHFGIHINVKAFNLAMMDKTQENRTTFFQSGVAHEYFHHIVDSWCVINEINREELKEQYVKQVLREERGLPLLILEESMANQFAFKWTECGTWFPTSGTYSMWEPFSSNDVWSNGSVIVALQYIHGTYMIDGLIPKTAFTKEILEKYEVPEEWRNRVSDLKQFQHEGMGFGFGQHYESGIWSIENIPLITHHGDKKWFVDARGEFVTHIKSMDSDEEE